ncbi:MAG: DUF1501 domain-containing protein [Planctomycetia bacterium]|nr:DUF1501 domain-containing protein [Planctomycetia bacterium]
MLREPLHRRRFFRSAAAAVAGYSACGWLPSLARALATDSKRRRQCILLWMNGGPSQLDTFDLKPGHANGGEFHEIETSAPGLRISEHLPKLAAHGDRLAILRGLSTKEGDHGRGTYLVRTGHQPGGPVSYPAIGAALAKELGNEEAELPNYISIAPYQAFNQMAYGPGFLGPKFAAAAVDAKRDYGTTGGDGSASAGEYADLRIDNLLPAGDATQRVASRVGLWEGFEGDFLRSHRTGTPIAHQTVYNRALRMMRSPAAAAFDLSSEPATVRDAYGRGVFGQGCLMARRLIEHGVPFVEVSLGDFTRPTGNWDTHQSNFATVKALSAELDAGWGTLIEELKERGLLDTTTIIWMGEFGRTPVINAMGGRDHFPGAWTTVLAGGGVRGGQAHGRTSEDGTTVEDGKVAIGDVLATLSRALGVDPDQKNVSEQGRPIRVAEGVPIREVLA